MQENRIFGALMNNLKYSHDVQLVFLWPYHLQVPNTVIIPGYSVVN
jgi:hypothetical protein